MHACIHTCCHAISGGCKKNALAQPSSRESHLEVFPLLVSGQLPSQCRQSSIQQTPSTRKLISSSIQTCEVEHYLNYHISLLCIHMWVREICLATCSSATITVSSEAQMAPVHMDACWLHANRNIYTQHIYIHNTHLYVRASVFYVSLSARKPEVRV